MSKCIALYGEKILCIGNMKACESYINQLYDYKLETVEIIPFNKDHYFYEDYELVCIREYKIFLTMGEVKLMQESCKEEQSSVNYIQGELDKLIASSIFTNDLVTEMENMKTVLEKIKREHVRYLNTSLFDNLELDSLHNAFVMERENKGLPTIYVS